MYDLIIVGAGPAGIMASITATLNNKKVLLIDKNEQVGKKILLTGNGRGNFTNLYLTKADYNNPLFVEEALSLFNINHTLNFFYKLGLPYKTEKTEGRCYPASNQASSITDVLIMELKRLNINTLTSSEVSQIIKDDTKFTCNLADGSSYHSKNIIISTGGLTYPLVGTTGGGYNFAKDFKHTVTPLYPALTRIHLKGNFKAYKGARLTNKLTVLANKRKLKDFYGDIIFNDFGIGGIASFAVSKYVNLALSNNKVCEIIIELSDLSYEELKQLFTTISYKNVFESLIGLVPKRIIPLVLQKAKINDYNLIINNLKEIELNNLIKTIKEFRFLATKTDGYNNAQITIGGINTNEVNPKTLQSKLIKGLYFCGEILDIDSKSGGFNLQWAWSSGYLAGLLL